MPRDVSPFTATPLSGVSRSRTRSRSPRQPAAASSDANSSSWYYVQGVGWCLLVAGVTWKPERFRWVGGGDGGEGGSWQPYRWRVVDVEPEPEEENEPE